MLSIDGSYDVPLDVEYTNLANSAEMYHLPVTQTGNIPFQYTTFQNETHPGKSMINQITAIQIQQEMAQEANDFQDFDLTKLFGNKLMQKIDDGLDEKKEEEEDPVGGAKKRGRPRKNIKTKAKPRPIPVGCGKGGCVGKGRKKKEKNKDDNIIQLENVKNEDPAFRLRNLVHGLH